jgi:uncharacterized protein DUF6152
VCAGILSDRPGTFFPRSIRGGIYLKNKVLAVLCGTIGLLTASAPLLAHHNLAYFDTKTVTTVTGTVREFNWTNPHATIMLDVKDDKGEVVQWIIECGPPNQLHRDNGMSSESLKIGDQITVGGHPYKDGKKIMRPTRIVLPDGKEVQPR